MGPCVHTHECACVSVDVCVHLHVGVSMSMSVIAHGAEHRWQHLNGRVTLAGTGARVVGTGRGCWGGAGLRALLSWAHRIQHIPAALEGPSSRHHLRDSHVTPAPNHQDSCSSCEAIEILTPRGTSQLSSVTETATFKRGSWGTWVSKEGFCEEATPSPYLGISLWTKGTSSVFIPSLSSHCPLSSQWPRTGRSCQWLMVRPG